MMSSTDRTATDFARCANEICDAVRLIRGAKLTQKAVEVLTTELRRVPWLSTDIADQVFNECSEQHDLTQPIDDESFKRIVWRVSKQTVRKACRHVQATMEFLADPTSVTAATTQSTSPNDDDVRKVLATLTPEELCMIQCRIFDGLSAEATALCLGISPSTFFRHWKSLMMSLRRKLE